MVRYIGIVSLEQHIQKDDKTTEKHIPKQNKNKTIPNTHYSHFVVGTICVIWPYTYV